jgi:hypothetical protein
MSSNIGTGYLTPEGAPFPRLERWLAPIPFRRHEKSSQTVSCCDFVPASDGPSPQLCGDFSGEASETAASAVSIKKVKLSCKYRLTVVSV